MARYLVTHRNNFTFIKKTSRYFRLVANSEYRRIWKEADMAYFKVAYIRWPRETEEND
jgi:hypothetical protein